MENKKISLVAIIIICILVVFFVSIKFFNNESPIEKISNQNEQNNLNVEQSIDPRVEKSLEMRSSSMNIVNGSLSQVGDDYFTIELATLKDADFDFSSGEEPEFNYEYTKVKISQKTEIVDMNEVPYFTIPKNISGALNTLKHIQDNHINDYNVYIYAAYPEEGGDVASYIEWSALPK